MEFDTLTNRILAEYELFLFALTGAYQAMRAPGVEVTPSAIVTLQVNGYRFAKTFCDIAEADIDTYLKSLSVDEADKGIKQRKSELKALICKMVTENVRQVAKMAKTGIGNYAQMLKGAHGAVGLLAQSAAGHIEFKVTDLSGRKWSAVTLMRVLVRDFAYQTWLESMFEQMMINGVDLVVAYYSDPSRNVVFSLSGKTPGYKSLADIRASVFHINSTALVRPYVST